jgi:hypothetical protein
MNACEICGIECEDYICNDCQYRMDSGDSSDILQRVQNFDNTEYEIDQIKNYICQYFNIDNCDNQGRKEPYITAKQLFIYTLLTRFKMRICDICKLTGLKRCDVIYIRTKWNKKLSCELTNKKWLDLINSK